MIFICIFELKKISYLSAMTANTRSKTHAGHPITNPNTRGAMPLVAAC
jgi:hypothetical protein